MISAFSLLAVGKICPQGADADCATGLPQVGATSGNLQMVVQIVLGIFAAIAVLMIVIAGLNFVNAQGDPGKIAKARDTIIYALIGLVVSISAEAIVAFALGKA